MSDGITDALRASERLEKRDSLLRNLTDEEVEIILHRRKAEEEKAERKRLYFERLKVAYDFAVWMDENGCGPTFSTFHNEFGYDGPGSSEMYRAVLKVQEVAAQQGD